MCAGMIRTLVDRVLDACEGDPPDLLTMIVRIAPGHGLGTSEHRGWHYETQVRIAGAIPENVKTIDEAVVQFRKALEQMMGDGGDD